MIQQEDLRKIIEEEIVARGSFLVDLTVSSDSRIVVKMDSMKGLAIETCGEVNRKIQAYLEENEIDASVEVSSPGLGSPFKVLQQYEKNIGKEIAVTLKNGEEVEGVLRSIEEETITIDAIKRKVNKEKQSGQHTLLVKDIVKAENVIKF